MESSYFILVQNKNRNPIFGQNEELDLEKQFPDRAWGSIEP